MVQIVESATLAAELHLTDVDRDAAPASAGEQIGAAAALDFDEAAYWLRLSHHAREQARAAGACERPEDEEHKKAAATQLLAQLREIGPEIADAAERLSAKVDAGTLSDQDHVVMVRMAADTLGVRSHIDGGWTYVEIADPVSGTVKITVTGSGELHPFDARCLGDLLLAYACLAETSSPRSAHIAKIDATISAGPQPPHYGMAVQ
jgi:hypothetical protein